MSIDKDNFDSFQRILGVISGRMGRRIIQDKDILLVEKLVRETRDEVAKWANLEALLDIMRKQGISQEELFKKLYGEGANSYVSIREYLLNSPDINTNYRGKCPVCSEETYSPPNPAEPAWLHLSTNEPNCQPVFTKGFVPVERINKDLLHDILIEKTKKHSTKYSNPHDLYTRMFSTNSGFRYETLFPGELKTLVDGVWRAYVVGPMLAKDDGLYHCRNCGKTVYFNMTKQYWTHSDEGKVVCYPEALESTEAQPYERGTSE